MKRRVRVGILFGGKSGEHEVSLASARSVIEALDKHKYEPILIAIDKQGAWLTGGAAQRQLAGAGQSPAQGERTEAGAEPVQNGNGAAGDTAVVAQGARNAATTLRPSPLRGVDVVFPILHGPMGEDGTVQGLLELADIPYVGAGVAASAVGMDKELMKRVFIAHGLPVGKFVTVRRWDWEKHPDEVITRIEGDLHYPVFTKPVNMGSSVGISKAWNGAELAAGIAEACGYDRKVIIEQGFDAREVECSVLGNDEPLVSVVGEIRTRRRDFYDYIAKYTDGEADLDIPANLPGEQSDEVRALAARAYRAMDCAGMARADFFIERGTGKVYLNELNTIPGFTRFSMYPKLWEASGLSYSELVDRLIALAIERYADKKRSGL